MREPNEALKRLREIVEQAKVRRVPDPSRGLLRLPSAAGRKGKARNTPKIITASDQSIK